MTTQLEIETAGAEATTLDRVLAAAFHVSWLVGFWPDVVIAIVWYFRGKPRFLSAHMMQAGWLNVLVAPLAIVGVGIEAGFGAAWSLTSHGADTRGLIPGVLTAVVLGGLVVAVGVVESFVGAFNALRGRVWANLPMRVLGRRYAASLVQSPLPEADRLLAARAYFYFPAAVYALLTAPKDARQLRQHAIQGVALGMIWAPLLAGLIIVTGAFIPSGPNHDQFEWGLALPLAASVPVLALAFAAAVFSFRAASCAARGVHYAVPIVGRIAGRAA